MLTVQNLYQIFHAGEINEIHALRGIDLELPSQQFVTVIGSNGAGKSTLFNTIAGVSPPTRGRIIIDGTDVTRWPEHRRAHLVGRVFQNPLLGTASTMSIAQNLTLALLRSQRLRLRSGVTADRTRRFQEWLEPLGLGLEKRLDSRVALLSGGQRQALTLLMAVLAQPKILLLDEHTAALDPATAVKILELTGQIIEQQSLTTLMITHNMQQALAFGDRMLMMDAGQVVLDLPAEEKAHLSVQDLIDKFTAVRSVQLADDELLLA
jgi:putative tryptophan/tyrosine transport system ATP-binding protein